MLALKKIHKLAKKAADLTGNKIVDFKGFAVLTTYYYSENKAQENKVVSPTTSYEHGAYKENRYEHETTQTYR